jgi:hypothetical protein
LLQYNVFNDSLELSKVLVNLGSKNSIKQPNYYEPAFQLGIDMMKRMRLFSEVVTTLVAEDLVMRALDFAIENDVHGMK